MSHHDDASDRPATYGSMQLCLRKSTPEHAKLVTDTNGHLHIAWGTFVRQVTFSFPSAHDAVTYLRDLAAKVEAECGLIDELLDDVLANPEAYQPTVDDEPPSLTDDEYADLTGTGWASPEGIVA